jgi:histidine ammonia-lyase
MSYPYTFTSSGANLTPEDLVRIARSPLDHATSAPTNKVALSTQATEAVNRSRAIVDGIVERGDVVYGITTGFGAFKDKIIPLDELAQLQVNLILSHCVGVGPLLPSEVVRAMMLSRAHTLSLGYSGIRLQTLQFLYDMLNLGIHPLIPEQGSVGSSGDLAPLSHLALAMIGLGDAEYQGRTLPTADLFSSLGLSPTVLAPKEGLALTNGTSLMSALLSLAAVDAAMLCDTADVAASMTLEALQATPAAFDPRIHAARPYLGQTHVAFNIRAITGGSNLLYTAQSTDDTQSTQNPDLERSEGSKLKTLTSSEARGQSSPKVQDAYSLRCIPQVHGAARDTVGYVRSLLLIELNSANDNPLIFGSSELLDESQLKTQNAELRTDDVLSGGNFHGAPLSVAADILSIGVCQLANISERRQARLLDPAANAKLLPPFLTPHGGLNSGFMMLQYTAAALASENKSLAHPSSIDTIPTSNGWEDLNSMGPIAARHARAIVANTARILALEALCAAQALDLRLRNDQPNAHLGRGTRAAYDLIRSHIPFIERDEDIRPHIAGAEHLVFSGQLAATISAAQNPV